MKMKKFWPVVQGILDSASGFMVMLTFIVVTMVMLTFIVVAMVILTFIVVAMVKLTLIVVTMVMLTFIVCSSCERDSRRGVVRGGREADQVHVS